MKEIYRILHLEDVPADAELVARELKKSNISFEHLVIDREDEYRDALNYFKPDIILCDHSLPSFTSVDALRILKLKKLHIPFVLITATMSEEVALGVVKEGANDYILKDRLKRLPNAVLNNIEKYRFERERTNLIDEIREREISSKALLENLTNKLLLATKVTGIGIWEYNIHTNQFAADENLMSIYGIPLLDFESLRRPIHPGDKERVTLELHKALMQHSELNSEFRIQRCNGTVRYIKAMTIIQRDTGGIATRIIGTNQDVTQDRMAAEALKESEKRFRMLIENLPEALYTCDANGKIIMYNRAAVKLWGREPEIGKDLWCGSHKMFLSNETFLPHHKSPMAHTLKTRKGDYVTELIVEHENGERRYARANPIPLFDQHDNVIGAVNMLVDITHIKQVEENLRTSNERYQIVTKATNDGIWDWNLETNEMYWSKSYERISGYKNEGDQVTVDQWFNNIHPDDKDRVKKGVLEAVDNTDSLWEDEYRYLKANGEAIVVHDKGYIMYNQQDKPIRFVGAMEDITQPKKIETEREQLIEHLVKSNNDLKQFSYITSHNFRAPLSNLLGLLSLVDYTTLSASNREIIVMFEKSTQQLNKTINDLIQILIIKKNVDINIVSNNVDESIDDVCELLAQELKETEATIVKNIEVGEILLNKMYMQSILINLISNALKYRSAYRKPVIEITTEQKQNGDVLMVVKDNGSGIDMERYQDRIFGLYQRFHSNIGGAGLGLYMVKTQIMALGGNIEVQSEEEKGTTFYLTFKLKQNFMVA